MVDGPGRVARAEMLVRCPPGQVFDAFANPGRITQFWLAETSGPLAPGAHVEWKFMVPGARNTVRVTDFQTPRRIAFDWSDGTSVAISFEPHGTLATIVSVEMTGFAEDAPVDIVVDAASGFSIVLCDLKTLLENGRSAHLVRDKAQLIAEGR